MSRATMKHPSKELALIISCSEEWFAFASAMGWEVLRFTEGHGASFVDSRSNVLFRLTDGQRDDILRAISSATEVA